MKKFGLALLLLAASLAVPAFAQQPNDDEYTKQIRQFTTEPRFMTELVDHLPAHPTIPTPLKFHGYIAGAEGKLTYAEDVYRYMRALDEASPRVLVQSIGRSEEGREMIVVIIANEETIANLDRYREITRRLSDPRKLTDDEAKRLITEGKPIYYATGAMHSPETGSPEMLMELAYRLAVEETPAIRSIRDNMITLLTPVIEVDGRNRQVDLWRWRQANPGVPTPPLVYWGHYVAHDNNRDQIGMALSLSQNLARTYFDFHPQVVHDLHESVPFMYISTGTGPYNPALDPLMIDDWHRMAYHEVDEMTRRGVPGVWTHGFYDGWAPNYMFWIAMGHNSIGRFYETYGNRWPTTETRVVRGASDRAWYRPNPPLPTVKWSLRNNVNLQQSGVLLALTDMAANRERWLDRFYTLGKRSIAKASNEGPAAYVFDGSQKRQGQLHDLMALLKRHQIEVHVADAPFTMKTNWPPNAKDEKAVDFPRGSFVVRMDQPYSRLADALLDVQFVRGDERVYDDTGWTLGYLKNVTFARVANPDVLKVKMTEWAGTPSASPLRGTLAIANNADTSLARLRFAAKDARILVTQEEFTSGKQKFPAGTILVDNVPAPGGLNLSVTPIDKLPNVKTRELRAPRIALMHTWQRTQDEGWWRLALESMGVPFDYISTQDASAMPALRERYDVILFPPSGLAPSDIVNGFPAGPPMPWKKTDLTPNLGGVDETDDMRPGLGLSGVANLQRFVEDGGLLLTSRDTSALAVQYGLARWVRVVESSKLKSPGTIVLATVVDRKSPVVAGYDETLPVVFAGSPIFRVGAREERDQESRPSGRGTRTGDPDVPQGRPYVPLPERAKPAPGEEGFQPPEDAPWSAEAIMPRPEDRPRVLVSFAAKADQLLLSGMLEGGEEIAGKPAVILVPRGKGNIILMSNNPMWRMNTEGSYALVMNAIMNWDALR
ncbi:MAG TPA: M14 family zinc carboxypeptidase [Thermoanaerobaculia bacterium]